MVQENADQHRSIPGDREVGKTSSATVPSDALEDCGLVVKKMIHTDVYRAHWLADQWCFIWFLCEIFCSIIAHLINAAQTVDIDYLPFSLAA
ncbi:MAG: hypothetical protein ONB33_03360 [candidate division KSB1 bacterium]|nr:hypothetical protein [candidate division KSB1 bacterium]MDZ7356625.1 hypothetical protein [candidate division KSB1 bacterium]MDZ7398979.1 hypothetical protein [candidate division KSB1 bacterium]